MKFSLLCLTICFCLVANSLAQFYWPFSFGQQYRHSHWQHNYNQEDEDLIRRTNPYLYRNRDSDFYNRNWDTENDEVIF